MAFALETHNLHPATLLALQAMQDLPEDFLPQRIYDFGCGNGILSIVAASAYPSVQIEAVDISANAVADARAAAEKHGVAFCLNVHLDDINLYLKRNISALRAHVSLVLCNLLAELLIPAAPGIKETVRSGGYAVLSGILAWRAAEIEALYTGLGFEIARKYENSPWVCYLLCHKSETIAKPIVTKA